MTFPKKNLYDTQNNTKNLFYVNIRNSFLHFIEMFWFMYKIHVYLDFKLIKRRLYKIMFVFIMYKINIIYDIKQVPCFSNW